MYGRSCKNREPGLLIDNLTSLKYLAVAYCQVVQAIHSGSLQHSSSAVSRTVSVSAAVQIFVWTGTEFSCYDICTKLKVATGNIGFLTKKKLNFLVKTSLIGCSRHRRTNNIIQKIPIHNTQFK